MINLVTLVGTTLPRTIAPLFPDVVWRMPSRDRTAYLTFDDGPNPDVTRRIMDVLGRFDATGTFFLLGSKAERHPDLVRALRDGGNTLGNHTYSHPDAWRTPRSALIDELDRTTDVLEGIIGSQIGWMRPPYGHFTGAMRRWCARRGQKLAMWDLGVGDYLDSVSGSDVERHVASYLRGGSIIVLHDNPRCADRTPDALEKVLRRLASDGWRFDGLPERSAPATSGMNESAAD